MISSAMSDPREMDAQQVEKRKEKNPYNIDKVPIQSREFERRIVSGRKMIRPSLHKEDGEDANADDHVEGVQSSHGEVQRKEQFCRSRVRTGIDKRISRHQVLGKFVRIFGKLNAEERQTK